VSKNFLSGNLIPSLFGLCCFSVNHLAPHIYEMLAGSSDHFTSESWY